VGGALSILSADEWRRQFREFEHTAFRLETRERYNSPGETERVRRFLAGEPLVHRDHDWFHLVREATRAGRTWRRVRIVSRPLSDYSRYGLNSCVANNAAGEDIRYLDRDEARTIGLADDADWWLFDSHRLVRMRFDPDDDRFLGGEPVTDPVAVVDANRQRDLAWHHAWLRETFHTG
jgi:hypothetical protein